MMLDTGRASGKRIMDGYTRKGKSQRTDDKPLTSEVNIDKDDDSVATVGKGNISPTILT